jgi:hypothetical protein
MKLTEGKWHTNPHGIRVPTHEVDSCRGWDLGVNKNCSQRREREWGKKKDRREEGERGKKGSTSYVKGKGANLVGAHCALQGARDAGALPMGPDPRSKGAKANSTLLLYKVPTTSYQQGGFGF